MKLKSLWVFLLSVMPVTYAGLNIGTFSRDEPRHVFQLEGEQIFDNNLIRLMNRITTREVEPISFNQTEMEMLLTECKFEQVCLTNKRKVLKKYRLKMQMLQCVNGLIISDMINNIEKTVHDYDDKSSEFTELLKKYTFIMTRMLSVLYAYKFNPQQWQMMVHINILAMAESSSAQKTSNLKIILNARFQLSDYIDCCYEHKYLDKKQRPKLNAAVFNMIIRQLYNYDKLEYAYRHADAFTISNLTLEPLHEHFDDILGKTANYNFDWARLKLKWDSDVSFVKKSSADGVWPLKPFENNMLHNQTTSMVYAKVVHSIWSHLIMYQHRLRFSWYSTTKRTRLNKLLGLFLDPLVDAIRTFDMHDTVVWPAYILITQYGNNNKGINKTKLNCVVKKTRNALGTTLKLMYVEHVKESLTKNTVKILKNVKDNEVHRNIEDFKSYTSGIKKLLNPTDILFIRFFAQAEKNYLFFNGESWGTCKRQVN